MWEKVSLLKLLASGLEPWALESSVHISSAVLAPMWIKAFHSFTHRLRKNALAGNEFVKLVERFLLISQPSTVSLAEVENGYLGSGGSITTKSSPEIRTCPRLYASRRSCALPSMSPTQTSRSRVNLRCS